MFHSRAFVLSYAHCILLPKDMYILVSRLMIGSEGAVRLANLVAFSITYIFGIFILYVIPYMFMGGIATVNIILPISRDSPCARARFYLCNA